MFDLRKLAGRVDNRACSMISVLDRRNPRFFPTASTGRCKSKRAVIVWTLEILPNADSTEWIRTPIKIPSGI